MVVQCNEVKHTARFYVVLIDVLMRQDFKRQLTVACKDIHTWLTDVCTVTLTDYLTAMVVAPMSFMARASSSLSSCSTLNTPSSPEWARPLRESEGDIGKRRKGMISLILECCIVRLIS